MADSSSSVENTKRRPARSSSRSGPLEGVGVVYVYFESRCAAAHDSRDCREIPQPFRPAFDSMAACSAHADAVLRHVSDPTRMASCMKQREG